MPRTAGRRPGLLTDRRERAADAADWRALPRAVPATFAPAATLARLASGYVEAGWLALAVAAALLFQPISVRPFDFPKVTLLLILTPWLLLAAGIALATIARSADTASDSTSPADGQTARTTHERFDLPMVGAALVAGSYLLSTALSIDPRTSFWGSRFNSEGCATALASLAVFGLIARFAQRPDQLRRLLDVILLTSLPVALYGIAQQLDLDPLAAARATPLPDGRVISSLGNPILAGGYAAIVAPIALARAIQAGRRLRGPAAPAPGWRALRSGLALTGIAALLVAGLALYLSAAARAPLLWWGAPVVLIAFLLIGLTLPAALPGRLGAGLAALGWAVLLGLQLTLLALTRSRGPLVAAVLALVLVLLLRVRPRCAVAVVAGAGGLVVAALVASAAGGRWPGAAVDAAGIGRLLRVDAAASGTVEQRLVIWRVVATLWREQPQVGPRPDPLAPARWLVGYGPETLSFAYDAAAMPDARAAVPYRVTRAHDEPLDALATRGAIGLLAWVFLIVALALAAARLRPDAAGARRADVAGLIGALTAGLVVQGVEASDPSLTIHFWILSGALASRAAGVPLPGDGLGGDPSSLPPPSRRWAAAGFLAASAAGLLALAAAGPLESPPGLALVGWLVVALAAIAWGVLPASGGWIGPVEGRPPPRALHAAPVRVLALPLLLLPFGLAALLISTLVQSRLEAGVHSKAALEAAGRGDLTRAFALGRSAVRTWPTDELYHAHFARVLATLANAARDEPSTAAGTSPAVVPSVSPEQVLTLGKRELASGAQASLERAVALAPLEYENHLNLEIVHRALSDLGEPGHEQAALAQARLRARLRPNLSAPSS